MVLKVGKRYSFSPYWGCACPKKKPHDGILESLDQDWAYLVCRNGDRWRICKDHVLPFKR